VVRFYTTTFPQIFRETFPFTVAALSLFVMAALMAALLCFRDPAFERYLLGPQMMDSIARHQMWTESVLTMQPLASSHIMTNNLAVTFFTYASGILAGLGTLYLLLLNGLLIGVVSVACYEGGMSAMLWSFVAPHGVLELPAIFISGGAGLLLARGLLFPGNLTRRDSLVLAGAQSVKLVLGIVPMLVVAGITEAFLSPAHISMNLKFLFAAGMFSLLVVYLAFAGRSSDAAQAAHH
jgi:uncharacterized membrane protein SpoIIM required for sporulation